MLKAVLFDDEKLALKALQAQLDHFQEITITGMYTRYGELVTAVTKDQPDIAFIDIETPGKSGLEIARELHQTNSAIIIVFVTAYRQYACEAFELEAADYILKPVRKERLERVIAKAEKLQTEKTETPKLYLKTLKKFEVRNAAGKIINWRTKKVEELLAYLLHHKGQEVTSDAIIEALSFGDNLEKSKKMLYTTVYYLRKDLQSCGMGIDKRGQKYTLPAEKVQSDVDEFEVVLKRVDTNNVQTPASLEKLFDIYRGGYLEENYYHWADAKRIELESRFINTVMKFSEFLVRHNKHLDAELALKRLVNSCPYKEQAYKLLMKVYQRMGDRQGMERTYKTYVKMMTELGIPPEQQETI